MDDAPHVLGDPSAPVTVCEFGDYECPYCGAASPVLRALVAQSEGRVRLLWRNFPLFEVHPHALAAALAVESAAQTSEDAFWAMHALVFEHQGKLGAADLEGYAAAVGADPVLATGPAAQVFAARVQADYAAGVALGVEGTPTLFVDGQSYRGKVELGALQRVTATVPAASAPTGSTPGSASAGRRRPWQRG